MPRPALLLAALALVARLDALTFTPGEECDDLQEESGCCKPPWEVLEPWDFVREDQVGGAWTGTDSLIRWDFDDSTCGATGNKVGTTEAIITVKVPVDTDLTIVQSGVAVSVMEKIELFDGKTTSLLPKVVAKDDHNGVTCTPNACVECAVEPRATPVTLSAGQHQLRVKVSSIDHDGALSHDGGFFQLAFAQSSDTCSNCICAERGANPPKPRVQDTVSVGHCLLSASCDEEGPGCEGTSCYEFMSRSMAMLEQTQTSTLIEDTCAPALKAMTGQCAECSGCGPPKEERLFASGWPLARRGPPGAAAAAALAAALSALLAGAAAALRRPRAVGAASAAALVGAPEEGASSEECRG